MYRFITSLIVLCSYFVMSSSNADGGVEIAGFGLGVEASIQKDDGAVWPEGQKKPTESDAYKNDGIHVYEGTDVKVYGDVCEEGDGLVVRSDDNIACIDKYGKMVPNSNNTKGTELFSITGNDLPKEVRDDVFFVNGYIARVKERCDKMACKFKNVSNSTLKCYDTYGAMAGASDEKIAPNDYWDNIDPTRTNEYINDGLLELVEKGRNQEFGKKCEDAGGVHEWIVESIEPFAIGCLNPDNGKWLPNEKNMANGSHSISFDETTPWVLQEHAIDESSFFDHGYIKDWIEYCEEPGWHYVVRDDGATLGCCAGVMWI